MKKAYKISTYVNPSLCILFLLANSFELNVWIQIGLAVLFFTNLIALFILSYKNKKISRDREKEIAGEAIAAMEAGDYRSTMHIVQNKFKNNSRLSTAFQFYCLGILTERTKKDDVDIIMKMDEMRDNLFTNKLIDDEN